MRHAYLIMAHNQFDLLFKLVKALNSCNSACYIHVDGKVDINSVPVVRQIIDIPNVFFLPNRVNVTWGDYSQIEAEYRLLKAAARFHYDYYHLLSGVDFPLKSQKFINSFFEENNGKEFIHFDSTPYEQWAYRFSKYHLISGRNKNIFLKIANCIILSSQFFVNRAKNTNLQFKKGANWFSISDDLAQFVIEKESVVRKLFSHSLCSDEVFLQTIVYNSHFKYRVYSYINDSSSIMRYIDWNRGHPYIFRMEDYNELITSQMLFGRKFDYDSYPEIVDRIFNYITKE